MRGSAPGEGGHSQPLGRPSSPSDGDHQAVIGDTDVRLATEVATGLNGKRAFYSGWQRPGKGLPPADPRKSGPRRIRTTVGYAGRFTVCSLWPLGHRPRSSLA